MEMDDEFLLRYSRQILLPEIDLSGQIRLKDSNVMLIGLGGLGSVVSMYLAAAGVGHLTLVDHDHVELSNLQRQIAHATDDIGTKKVDSAEKRLMALNPTINIVTVDHILETEDFDRILPNTDVIVDATDNFESRFHINEQSVRHQRPLVSGAAIRLEGQVSIFNTGRSAPCYRCLYSKDSISNTESCSESGVIAPLLGIIGSIQAMETLKLILGFGKSLAGRLLLLDSRLMEWHSVILNKDPNCPTCSN